MDGTVVRLNIEHFRKKLAEEKDDFLSNDSTSGMAGD
jgi:hypothetical protein